MSFLSVLAVPYGPMPNDLQTLGMENLLDAIRLMNESSRGTSLEFHLDLFDFLALAQYWNFSYAHSLIQYVNGEPAALMLNCSDPDAQDAYTFYWGTLPPFRKGRMSLRLVEASCQKFRDDGYVMMHAVSLPDRPVQRYRLVQFDPEFELLELQSTSAMPYSSASSYEVRPAPIDALAEIARRSVEPFHWCQRPSFFRNAGKLVECLGAFEHATIKAYLVLARIASSTTILDIRSPQSCFEAGHELLRWVSCNYQPPFQASYVFRGTYAHRLLAAANFVVNREFSTLRRDLRATCPT